MDPRLLLYNDLRSYIQKDVQDVQHIDLWNQNVVFVEQDAPWPRPAVFIEFGEIAWSPVKTDEHGRFLRGQGEIRLHIVTDWNSEAYTSAFDIGERIWRAMERNGHDGEHTDYSVYYPTATLTNHNHEQLVENIDVFPVKYLRWMDRE